MIFLWLGCGSLKMYDWLVGMRISGMYYMASGKMYYLWDNEILSSCLCLIQ